jgi:hypothetical protein
LLFLTLHVDLGPWAHFSRGAISRSRAIKMRTGSASFSMIARTRRPAVTTPTLTDQQLAELLELIKGSDTVELKLTVHDTDIGSVRQALELDLLDGQIRQIVFFDSLHLTLKRSGVVVRARRIQGSRGYVVVKLRPVLPDQISRQMRTSPGFGVEVDAMPGGGVSSASMKGRTTGGGSSRFTFGRGSHADERFSVNVGAVRHTERFHLDAVVAMGGAVTNMTAMKLALATYDPDVVHGTTLDRTEIDRQIGLYGSMNAAKRRAIVGLQPKRADVILAGAYVVRTVMEKLGVEAVLVSDRGLRHGVLIERFGP